MIGVDDWPSSGHPDVWGWFDETTVIIVDDKSAYVERSALDQLVGYAKLLMSKYPAVKSAILVQLNLNTGEPQMWLVLRQQAFDRMNEIAAHAANGAGNYHPGEHCQYCPRQSVCPGYHQKAQTYLQILTGDPTLILTDAVMADPSFVKRYQAAASLAAICHSITEHARGFVRRGGVVGDGEYELVQGKPPEKIDAAIAAPILLRTFTAEQIIAEVEISKEAVANLARTQGVRGAIRALNDDLKAAGAMKAGTARITMRKRNLQITGDSNGE